MDCFDNSNINLEVLKKKAFNYRWAEVPDGVIRIRITPSRRKSNSPCWTM